MSISSRDAWSAAEAHAHWGCPHVTSLKMDVNQNELRVLWSKLSPSLNRVSSVIWAGRLSLSLAAAASSQHHRRVLHVDECVLLITYTAVKLIKIDYIFFFFLFLAKGINWKTANQILQLGWNESSSLIRRLIARHNSLLFLFSVMLFVWWARAL